MSTETGDNFNDISSEAMQSAGMGIFKKEFANSRYLISNYQLLGLDSGNISFEEFAKYAVQDHIEPSVGGYVTDENLHGIEKILSFEVPGRNKIWIKTINFKKEITDKGEKNVWGTFRILDNRKPDSTESVEIFSNIIVRQKNITRFLSSFTNDHDPDHTINNILTEILLLFGGNRCYIFEYDYGKGLQKKAYEAYSSNIGKEQFISSVIPLNDTPYLNTLINDNKPLIIPDISDFSKKDDTGFRIMADQKIISLMIVPLKYGGSIKGYLGIDTLGEKRMWSVLEYQLLASFTAMIGICMEYTGSVCRIQTLSSDLEETRNRLKDSKNQLKEQDNNYLMFFSNISYEIRTQLNAIMGFASIMSIDEKNFSKENRYYLSVIRDNAEALINMITNIINRINPDRQTVGSISGARKPANQSGTKNDWDNYYTEASKEDSTLLTIPEDEKPAINDSGTHDKIDNDPVILIVEDNESNFRLLSILLKQYALLWAEDGVTAIDIYNKHKPDLILMDIQLPREDGLSATRRIRKTDQDTPIIAITANAMDTIRKKAFDAGCDEFLVKPVNNNLLKDTIKKYLKTV